MKSAQLLAILAGTINQDQTRKQNRIEYTFARNGVILINIDTTEKVTGVEIRWPCWDRTATSIANKLKQKITNALKFRPVKITELTINYYNW